MLTTSLVVIAHLSSKGNRLPCSTQALWISSRSPAGVGFQPFIFPRHNTRGWFSPKARSARVCVTQISAGPLEPFVGFLRPEGAAVLKNKLID